MTTATHEDDTDLPKSGIFTILCIFLKIFILHHVHVCVIELPYLKNPEYLFL